MSILHDCPISHIKLDAPQLHGYQAFYTSNNDSSGKNVNKSKHSMPMTLYFAICQFSAPDTVFLTLPRMPPKGIITSILVKFIITGIFGIITARSCYCMWRRLCVAEIQALSQRLTNRPITDGSWTTQNISGCNNNEVDQFNNVPLSSWHLGI